MTPEERKANLDATAAERAGTLTVPTQGVTLENLHARLTALERHPALGSASDGPQEEEHSNG